MKYRLMRAVSAAVVLLGCSSETGAPSGSAASASSTGTGSTGSSGAGGASGSSTGTQATSSATSSGAGMGGAATSATSSSATSSSSAASTGASTSSSAASTGASTSSSGAGGAGGVASAASSGASGSGGAGGAGNTVASSTAASSSSVASSTAASSSSVASSTAASTGSSSGAGGAGAALVWSKSWGNAQDQEPTSIAVDPSDNVIIGGYYDGAVDFGCGLSPAGAGDSGLVLKLSPMGDCIWVRHFGDPTTVNYVTTDAAGNVYATGYAVGPIDLGGGVLTGGGGHDAYVVKFDAAGTYQWGVLFGDAGDQNGLGVAVDAAGNVYATGSFQGTINLGLGPLSSAGGTDIYLAKFGPAGNLIWNKRFGDNSNQIGRAVDVDPSGNVLITGTLIGSANFGGQTLTSAGLSDVFIAKLSPAGTHLFSASYGNFADQFAQMVKSDLAGNMYMCGAFDGSVSFGGPALNTGGNYDAFFVKLDSAGGHVWSHRGGGPNLQSCNNIAVDKKGRVAVGGWFYGDGDFGGPHLVSAGAQDGFVAIYDAAGNHVFSTLYGDANAQANKGLAFDSQGYLLLTSFQTGPIDLGGGPKIGGGGEDIFAAKIAW